MHPVCRSLETAGRSGVRQVNHYILTRFSYPDSYQHLARRFEIFNRFTKPSVESQTNDSFTWIIKIREQHRHLFGKFRVKTELTTGRFPDSIKTNGTLITTRLDNDDIISDRFIDSIQQSASNLNRQCVIDCRGYRMTSNPIGFYHFDGYNDQRCSPFASLLSVDRCHDNILCEQHGMLHKRFEVHQLQERLWCQHIHDTNVCNRGHVKIACNQPEWFARPPIRDTL